MNIKGQILLGEKGLPQQESLFIFHTLSEIPSDLRKKYGEEKVWVMGGFDERTEIDSSLYDVKSYRRFEIPEGEFEKAFDEINSDMEEDGIPEGARIFLVTRVFTKDTVEFSGHALKQGDNIFIDILEGNRPSGQDWTPDHSFAVQIVDGRPNYDESWDQDYGQYIKKIAEDIIQFDRTTYLDFTKTRDGNFFYHDLSFVKA